MEKCSNCGLSWETICEIEKRRNLEKGEFPLVFDRHHKEDGTVQTLCTICHYKIHKEDKNPARYMLKYRAEGLERFLEGREPFSKSYEKKH